MKTAAEDGENGYEVLFIEHLFYDTNQKDLDEFFKTGKMSRDLMDQLTKMNQHGIEYSFGPASQITSSVWKNYNYVTVLHAAREAGIRVVGIDISTVYRSQKIGINNQQLDDTRIRYMNYTAAQIMEREIGFLPQGKKWCGFMGNAHVSTFENTPGVAELFDARSVYVFDQPQWMKSTQRLKSSVECNGEYIYSSGRAIFKGDAIYELDPRVDTSSYEHPTAIYKEKFANAMQPKAKLTSNDMELAIKYLRGLHVTELGKLFGFKEPELDDSYHMVEKIIPVNPQKTIEQSSAFSFIIENNYSHMESYTVYLSKDRILSFAAKQKEIDLQNYTLNN
ncbi:hypothetical protein DLD14_16095 [Legionella anisa]|nr:hypothetical protein DLD14_16095 [Legionella anisa]